MKAGNLNTLVTIQAPRPARTPSASVSPLNNGAEIPALPAEFTVDGVHLNDTWQQFLANIAAPVIRRIVGQ